MCYIMNNQIIYVVVISMILQVLILFNVAHSLKVIPQVLTHCVLISEHGEICLLGRKISEI